MSSGSGKKPSIPSKMKETVHNLKEIVNCTEQEIYAMLKDCNMDPNEAVHRLLTQDTFHEVRSKREKKKEVKGTSDSRSQKVGTTGSGRGVRSGLDHTGRIAVQINSDDCDATRGKPVYTKENGARNSHTSSVLGSGRAANTSSAWTVAPPSHNDSVGSTIHFPVLSETSSVPSSSSTLQNNWRGGQLSMADIVKMGRQRKLSTAPLMATDVCNSLSHQVVPKTSEVDAGCISTKDVPSGTDEDIRAKQEFFRSTDNSHASSIVVGQHEPLEEWTLVDHSAEETPVLVGVSGASSICHDPSASSSLHVEEISSQLSPHADIQNTGHVSGENLPTESTISDGQLRADSFGSSSCLDDGSYMNSSSCQPHEAEDVHEELSSTMANLQNLNLHGEEQDATSAEVNPAVIIPDHLQVTNTDCCHLSFGSFGSGADTSRHGEFLSKPTHSDLETPVTESTPPVDYSDTRHSEYYGCEELRSTSDENISPIPGTSSRKYDMGLTSQPETSRDDTFNSEQPRQYNIPSVSSFAFSESTQADTTAYNQVQANSEMQNLAPLSSITDPRTDSADRNLLGGTAQRLREPDLPFSQLLANQSMQMKYSASFSGPTTSMPEVLKSGLLSNFQSVPQTTSSSAISGGPALPPHLTLPTYSQPTLPLGPLTNMFSYPVHPQSIAYMPFSGSSSIHQSPASLQSAGMKYAFPQFKSSMALNGLPQSLPVGSGYGNFGGSSNIPGAFLQNPSNVAVGSATGYEEALRSQYKESVPLHQGDNNWLSRTLPPLPGSSFYGIQGPSQQQVLRQTQQPAHMGMMGYPNLYHHNQVGSISREHHQQLPSHGSLSGSSQGQASQQSFWQHNY